MAMSHDAFDERDYLRDVLSDSQVHRWRQNLERSRDISTTGDCHAQTRLDGVAAILSQEHHDGPAIHLAFPAWCPYQLSTDRTTGGEQGAGQPTWCQECKIN